MATHSSSTPCLWLLAAALRWHHTRTSYTASMRSIARTACAVRIAASAATMSNTTRVRIQTTPRKIHHYVSAARWQACRRRSPVCTTITAALRIRVPAQKAPRATAGPRRHDEAGRGDMAISPTGHEPLFYSFSGLSL